MNWKTILSAVLVGIAIAFMTVVVAIPAAFIMLEKNAMTDPSVIVSLVVFLGVGVALCSATLTSVRACPDDAPHSVINRQSTLYAAASFGLGSGVLFGLGILIGFLNATFTAQGDTSAVLFWATAMLLGVGVTLLLLSLLIIAWIHFANASVVMFVPPQAEPPRPVPPQADAGTDSPEPERPLPFDTAPAITGQEAVSTAPEPVPESR